MVARIGGEHGTHRFFRYVRYGESSWIAAGGQRGDRNEVLAVRLHRVCGWFAGLPIIEELNKPDRKRIGRCLSRRYRAGDLGEDSRLTTMSQRSRKNDG